MKKSSALIVLSAWFVSNVILFQNCKSDTAALSLGGGQIDNLQPPTTDDRPSFPQATLVYNRKMSMAKMAGTPPLLAPPTAKGFFKLSASATATNNDGVRLMESSCSGCGPQATEAFYFFKDVLTSALKMDSIPIVVESVVNFGLKDLEDSKPLYVRWSVGNKTISAKITSFKASTPTTSQPDPFLEPHRDPCFESAPGYRFHVCKGTRQAMWGEVVNTDVASVFNMKTNDEDNKKNISLNFNRFTKDASGYAKGTYLGYLATWENIGLPDESGRYAGYIKNGSDEAIEINGANVTIKSNAADRGFTAKMQVYGEDLRTYRLAAGSVRIVEGNSPSTLFHWGSSLQQSEDLTSSPFASVQNNTDYRWKARDLPNMTKLNDDNQCPQKSQVWDCSGDDFLDLDPIIDAGIEVPFINSIRSAINEGF